jgi:hypothetical protein
MKKLTILLLFIFSIFTLSCSRDNEEVVTPPSIVGKWEFSREGQNVNGSETINAYQHECINNKDFVIFNENGTLSSNIHEQSNNCLPDVNSGTWSKSGNNLTTSFQGTTETVQIFLLDASNLKVKTNTVNGTFEITELIRR